MPTLRRFYQPNIVSVQSGNHPRVADWRGGVVVRSPNWLGDAVMAMPALSGLRRALGPEVPMRVVAKTALRELWLAAPWVDGFIEYEGDGPLHGLPARLQSLDAQTIVVLPNSMRAALEAFGSRIPIRIGRGGLFRSWLLNRRLPRWRPGERTSSFHQASNSFSLVNLLAPVPVELPARTLAIADAAKLLKTLGVDPQGRFLAVAPGAAYGPAKKWPEARFAEVAESWCEGGEGVVVVGTDEDGPLGARICAQAGPASVNLCGRTTLREVMAVIQTASRVVANDSGAMHLAAALGTPGVAVYGSTNPAATGPLGTAWTVLHQPPSCAPCFQRDCPLKVNRYQCLTAISPTQVLQALKECC